MNKLSHPILRIVSAVISAGVLTLAALSAHTAEDAVRPGAAIKRQTLYLPVYSHIYHGSLDRKGRPGKTLLSVQVSIRNTDARRPLRIVSALYRNTEGQPLREYVPTVRTVPPSGALELFVEQHDESGGSGASFAIVWEADSAISPPLVEGVHATFEGARSVAFTTAGVPVRSEGE